MLNSTPMTKSLASTHHRKGNKKGKEKRKKREINGEKKVVTQVIKSEL